MTIQGGIGSYTFGVERASTGLHGPVIRTDEITAGVGEYPAGLLMAKAADGKAIPYEEIAAEALGAGDGAVTAFTELLASAPAMPGSVTVTDGVETFSDTGYGRLVGDAGGSGWVDYKAGQVSVEFATAPANEAPVTADYARALQGVLDEAVDISKATSAPVVIHGTVKAGLLKINLDGDAPSAGLLRDLREMGVFPV